MCRPRRRSSAHSRSSRRGPNAAGYLQLLTDLRHAALGQSASSVRPEVVTGDVESQLLHQLDALPDTMLVLGMSAADDLGRERLARFLEGPVARPVLIVRPFDVHAVAGH